MRGKIKQAPRSSYKRDTRTHMCYQAKRDYQTSLRLQIDPLVNQIIKPMTASNATRPPLLLPLPPHRVFNPNNNNNNSSSISNNNNNN